MTTHQTRRLLVRVSAGQYATVDGTEYKARASYRKIWLYLPTTDPRPDGWIDTGRGEWSTEVTRDEVTSLVKVRTRARFGSLPVDVLEIFPDGQVSILANPGAGGAGAQLARPPHAELSPLHGNAASLDGWIGRVAPERLTDVVESVEQLDVSLYGIPRPA